MTLAAPVRALCEPLDATAKPADDSLSSFALATESMRKARCATAICFGEGYKYGIEPLVELPIGKSFTSNGWGALAQFENSHDVSATFAAGLRFWAFKDWISIAVYLSKPLIQGSSTLRVQGSPFLYPSGNVRRPYPGAAIGVLADSIWLGVDVDELRNGDADSNRDPRFLPNAVVSRAVIFTVALTPITIARNALGAANRSTETVKGDVKQKEGH
jgi:hypothetical protein